MVNINELKKTLQAQLVLVEKAKKAIEEELDCGIIDNVEAVLRRNKQVEQMDGISKSSLIRYKNSSKYYDSGTRVTYGTSARNTGK